MHDDFDDTVLVPSRRLPQPDSGVDEDTVVPGRQEARVSAAAPVSVKSDAAKSEAAASAPHHEPGDASADASGDLPAAPAPQGPAVASTKSALNRGASSKGLPALVEPTPSRQHRVPLTHKRLQETLRVPEAAREPSVLPRAHSARPATLAPVYGFRMGDRAPVTLDVPALVGRKPAAPRIPGKVFPRLVRVSSPLSEVSGTHVELRQEGTSVIVTDLRSTNGTVVRMPGSRPIKLRQGESLVVRPGTLVDIGDGNVLEILPPPRLSVSGDAAVDGIWP